MSKLSYGRIPESRRSSVSNLRDSNYIKPYFETLSAPCSYVLKQKTEKLRSANIVWDFYVKCQIINKYDCRFLTNLGSLKQKERLQHLKSHPKEAFEIFMKILREDNYDSTLQYVLVLIGDMILDNNKCFEFFKEYEDLKESVWTGIFKHLNRPNSFTAYMASHIISLIAQSHPDFLKGYDLDLYFTWLMNQIIKEGHEYVHWYIRCLQTLLRKNEYRQTFANLNGIKFLVNCLERPQSFQIDYQLLFCLWMLTYNPNLAKDMENYKVIPVLSGLLMQSANEKVKRMLLAIFRNMLEKPDSEEVKKKYCVLMIQFQVLKTLSDMNEKLFSDPDIVDDMEYLKSTLLKQRRELNSFDMYVKELLSGHLEWTPVHALDTFWKENVENFNKHRHMAIKTLINYLNQNKDSQDLEVALHDIGKYIFHCKNGKNIVIHLGGKNLIMNLLTHENANVRYQALLCLQKLLLTNWQYLQDKLDKGKRCLISDL